MVWQLIAKPLLGVAADGVKAFAKNKAAKNELKLEEIKASKIELDKIMDDTRAVDKLGQSIAQVQQSIETGGKMNFGLLFLEQFCLVVFCPGHKIMLQKVLYF